LAHHVFEWVIASTEIAQALVLTYKSRLST
jgi:hypothetical protein